MKGLTMKVTLAASVLALLTACSGSVEPLCDRENVLFDKWGKVVDTCQPALRTYTPTERSDGPDSTPTKPTEQEPDKYCKDEKDSPTKGKDKPDRKGNASANNQKGGNYDRTGHSDNGKGQGRNKQR